MNHFFAQSTPDGRFAKLLSYGLAPDPADVPDGAFALTGPQYTEWLANPLTRKWDFAAAELVTCAAPPDLNPYDVPKLLVVQRLIDAGKLKAALGALMIDQPMSALTDAQLALRERWLAARVISSADPDAKALFTAIGADPAVILAKPPIGF